MKNINQKTVEALATTLKVDTAKLSEQLMTDEADVSKQATKVTDLLTGRKVFTDDEEQQLLTNHGKNRYDAGYKAFEEIGLKEVKKKLGLDPIDPKINSIETIVNKIVEQEKIKLGTEPDKRVKDLETEKANLQKTVTDLGAEVETWKTKVSYAETSGTIKSSILSALNDIQIDADATRLPAQREILQMAFEKKHEVKIEDGKQVVYRDGKKLVDNLQNPLPIADVMKDFAPQYVNVKTKTGRGDASSQQSQLSGELVSITDRKTLLAYLENKNIRMDSNEAMAVLKEVKEKNPAFKLN